MLFKLAAADWTSTAIAVRAVSTRKTWPLLPFIGLALQRLGRGGGGGVSQAEPSLHSLVALGQKTLFVHTSLIKQSIFSPPYIHS